MHGLNKKVQLELFAKFVVQEFIISFLLNLNLVLVYFLLCFIKMYNIIYQIFLNLYFIISVNNLFSNYLVLMMGFQDFDALSIYIKI